MDPVGQLPPQEWMQAPATRAVLAALTAEGAEARFVGGCVRDAVLKRPVRDIDIATHEPPERVMLLLEKAGIRVIPTGIEHGTVTAAVDGAHFEITTLRTDVESFGRKARVAFTDDWAADAARRDFTINALFADPDGRIYDPFDGLQDLGAARVRFVGDPVARIEEDVLRLLRFFRFFAHYGRPPPDVAALAACRRMAPQLPRLSGERVAGELIKLLQASDPASVLLLMRGEHVLEYVLPEAEDFGRLRVLCMIDSRGVRIEGVAPDPLRRLAAVLRTDAAGAHRIAARLRLSARQTERLVAMAAPPLAPRAEMDAEACRRALRRLGPDLFRDLVLIAWAGRRAVHTETSSAETGAWMRLLEAAAEWRPVELPVRGRDVLDLGIPPGPRVGELLAAVDEWWEARDYRPTREQALEKLREMVERAGG